jgi:sec-independent protein translocase protein TatA
VFAGLAAPSHLIIVLVVVLLLFGAKRIPELTKGLGTGVKELREGFPGGDDAEAGAPNTEKRRGKNPHDGSGADTIRTVGANARHRGL